MNFFDLCLVGDILWGDCAIRFVLSFDSFGHLVTKFFGWLFSVGWVYVLT